MKYNRRIYLVLFLLLVISVKGFCGIDEYRVDATSLALGKAFAGDAEAQRYLNPAAVFQEYPRHLSYTYSSLQPLDLSSQLMTIMINSFSITLLDERVQDVAGFEYKERMHVLSYGLKIGTTTGIGLSVREYTINCGDFNNKAYGYDLAILQNWKRFSLGGIVTNLGSNITSPVSEDETILPTARLGISITMPYGGKFNLDYDEKKQVYLGYQQIITQGLVLRVGVEAGEPRFGFGITDHRLKFDYVYSANSFCNEQRISLGIHF